MILTNPYLASSKNPNRSPQHIRGITSLTLSLSGCTSNPRGYLCNQKYARNKEQGFAPGHRNVNGLQDEKIENNNSNTRNEKEDSSASRSIELECETKRVPLDPRVLDKTVMISQDPTSNEKTELLLFLDKKQQCVRMENLRSYGGEQRHNRAYATGLPLRKT
jgi:hypothetical protein